MGLCAWLFLYVCLPFPVSSRKKAVEAKCSLACEYLSEEDYMDLLWTTLSEFPGEEPVGSGTGIRKPENVAAVQCHIPGATWKQILFPRELRIVCSARSYKLSRTVKAEVLFYF